MFWIVDHQLVSVQIWAKIEGITRQWPRQESIFFAEFIEKLRVVEGFQLVLAEKRKSWDPDPPAGSQDIILPQGRIWWADKIELTYQLISDDESVFYAPTIFSRVHGGASHVLGLELSATLTAVLPRHKIDMLEGTILLPTPPWTVAFNDKVEARFMFVTEAREALVANIEELQKALQELDARKES